MNSRITHPQVAKIFAAYPTPVRKKLLFLRQMIFDTAAEIGGVGKLEETVKWGEPAYLAKGASTIRIDWKSASPQQYAMYFHCQTKLVSTFRELYGDKFNYAQNRAIVFRLNDRLPVAELKHCIALSLTYHKIKHLPMLGA